MESVQQQTFRTVVRLPELPETIRLDQKLLSMGSCFSDHMAAQFASCRFQIVSNPTGILYNPASVARVLEKLADDSRYEADDLFLHRGLWRSFDHHSSFADEDQTSALESINLSFALAAERLRSAEWLLVTWGTAAVYCLRHDPSRVVANCHKLPQDSFRRRLLTVDEIVETWQNLLERLHQLNPNLKLLFTVSPVRHLRDDAHENQLSKAVLLLAQHRLICGREGRFYFPSYEIMLDELRDYRFCEADMAHPGKVARDYIWHRFTECAFDSRAREFVRAYEPVRQSMQHRPMTAVSAEITAFADSLLRKIDRLQQEYKEVDLDPARQHFLDLVKRSKRH